MIREFAGLMSGLYANSQDAQSYVARWLAIGYGDGRMFATIKPAADNALTTLQENYRKLTEISLSSCEQLNLAADHYERTDAEEAARLDGAY